MNTVAVSIPVLRWAAERAGLSDAFLKARFPKWPQWLQGMAQPTLRQLENFSTLTHTAFGYFFLAEPPILKLPIPDYRTVKDYNLRHPSSNLLDTVFLCQQRQEWYRQYASMRGYEALDWVGTSSIEDDPRSVADTLRRSLDMTVDDRRLIPNWAEALRRMINQTEELGVLVMVTSVVGSNSHRKLDVDEFRGFALTDALAPLIFVNGSDSKSAMMFTLAHELAHLCLGASGVSDSQASTFTGDTTERWCNAVAAELLVPIDEVKSIFNSAADLSDEVQRLTKYFKVSSLVVLRRLHEAELIDRAHLWVQYQNELDRYRQHAERLGSGGNFYRSLEARTSKRFAKAVVGSTLEGLTSYTEAFHMLGMRSAVTLHKAAKELGVVQ